MTTFIADHSTAGAIIGGSLRKAGFTGVIRYAAAGRGDVNITPAEIKDLRVNKLEVGIVVEHEANWLLHTGTVQQRVAGSRDITRACGLPDGVTYLAADFDVTDGGPTAAGSPGDRNMQQVQASLESAAAVLGQNNVGFYGSKFAIDWLVLPEHAPWLKFYWQTEAWSRGELSPAAQLFQRAQSTDVAGVSCDVDVQLKPEWGQRVAHPKPRPKPKPPKLTHDQQVFNQGFQSGFEAGWKARG